MTIKTQRVGPADPIVSKLIHLAAKLARGEGVPREFDVENFYASTPRAERRRITAAVDKVEEQHKLWAIELRRIADELSARTERTTQETAPEHRCGVQGFDQMKGDVCPACTTVNRRTDHA